MALLQEEVIGKVSATDRNPSTIDDFYFWTKAGCQLSPFDVVKVNHIDSSITYGVIESISHVTDSASHLSSFISSDFGDVNELASGNTDRLAFNYVKCNVVGNTKNVYTPVLHGTAVRTCNVEDIQIALGLKNVKNPLRCGYLEMYGQKVPVDINSNFLVGPDGAHLNISGISGLACKTSYCMFLLNALQQQYSKMEDGEGKKTIAFVIINVKGQDLLSIDEQGELSEKEKKLYSDELSINPTPFKNVHYFYPYSDKQALNHIQSFGNWDNYVKEQFIKGKADKFKYTFKSCIDKLEYIFANEEDGSSSNASSTMESIISYIANEQSPFGGLKSWANFQDKLNEVMTNANSAARQTIAFASWKKFKRIMDKVLSDNVFSDGLSEESHEVVLSESIKNIKPNEVKVIDIARLDDKTQAFVFGDIMETLNNMMSEKNIPGMPDKIVVFVDELNKYASSDVPKSSPILKQLLEITERGRSLGLILFSVEQFRSSIHDRVKGNCATAAYGRTNYTEVSKADYRFLGDVYRNMMTRLAPGEYIISNPALRSLIKIKFPKPVYKENK